MEQALDEAETALATLPDQFDGGDVHRIGTDLTIADHAVTPKLEPGDLEIDYPHFPRYVIVSLLDLRYQFHSEILQEYR